MLLKRRVRTVVESGRHSQFVFNKHVRTAVSYSEHCFSPEAESDLSPDREFFSDDWKWRTLVNTIMKR